MLEAFAVLMYIVGARMALERAKDIARDYNRTMHPFDWFMVLFWPIAIGLLMSLVWLTIKLEYGQKVYGACRRVLDENNNAPKPVSKNERFYV